MQTYKIEGYEGRMRRKALGTAIAMVPGVKSVDINSRSRTVKVEGEAMPVSIMAAASTLGYNLTLISA